MTPAMIRLPARFYRTYPVDEPLGQAEEVLDLDPARTVFLLIDVYGLGFDPAAPLADVPELYRDQVATGRAIMLDHIVPAKRAAAALGVPVVYLRNHLSDALTPHTEWRNVTMRAHGIDVLKSWQEPNDILAYSAVIAPQPGEHEVLKQFYSGFFQTGLEELLRSLGAGTLVTVGFDSRICVASTVTEAMYRDFRVIAVRDAIGTSPATTGDLLDATASAAGAVRYIETNVGYTVTSAQWIAACTSALGAAS